ncbi:hypothetical protein P261_00033 [Lachnospiraceae bacterium TWA4]|nr:hypothetical protein P261_00033 [Lachnospiraceae bacterium TWA4]
MNIKEAKEEIIHTVKAYTAQDENGNYLIPIPNQRPIFLVGPPGIGKTAIMEQASKQCEVGIVSYTITHHTRQSAIGLPHITHKTYDGKNYEITEYTMSEIIASIYDYIEETGYTKGILFIDEINCVSETLAPTMLQFLQYKTFGTHKVPDGWIIVAAGNPPEYNKSVRTFDIATLDRVRKMEIYADFEVWKEYALTNRVHGAIISYLSIKKENFYQIESDEEVKSFVTARGWEDLSKLMIAYEKLGLPIEKNLVEQFLQDSSVARDFTSYFLLYEKYKEVYPIEEILDNGAKDSDCLRIKEAKFDERLSVIELMIYKLLDDCKKTHQLDSLMRGVFRYLKSIPIEELQENIKAKRQILKDFESIQVFDWIEAREIYSLKEEFYQLKDETINCANQLKIKFEHAFAFIKKSLGVGQEMVLFISDLANNEDSVWYLSTYEVSQFFTYSTQFQLEEREKQLQKDILEVQNLFIT